ncbi:Ppx/GppA phosphatase family protein [Geomesophilobacter sediminis]|uniref:Exopolyphosphatase n=1 Tax=Geomesophilobacter sediminis TaxID=2798584 RepID=A0A8J7JKG3_9BACT|nr:exopolyphosphatase [Geomesophilobacter sediminis]MBJ6723875.1 exopolyphosphatase [Geomesophilobacter sediminis]
MSRNVAAIDLGTNTARLLIAQTHPFRQILLQRVITRLGGGFTREEGLSAAARARALAALTQFAAEIRAAGVERVRAVATSAVRDAANGAEFCRSALEETGISLEVIDGDEEARLTLQGVISSLDDGAGDLSVFDIGGGSTEYTLAQGGSVLFSRSLPIGVVRLTEGKSGVVAMEDKIGRELDRLKRDLEREGMVERFAAGTLIGTAGTATTLAAVQMQMEDYDYRKVNNFVLGLAEIEAIYRRLLPLAPAERLEVPGLEPGREDLIISGILITIITMRLFGFTRMKVSDSGLLEGLALEL